MATNNHYEINTELLEFADHLAELHPECKEFYADEFTYEYNQHSLENGELDSINAKVMKVTHSASIAGNFRASAIANAADWLSIAQQSNSLEAKELALVMARECIASMR